MSNIEKYKYSLFIFVLVFTYTWNFWINDIWIPNESFYAEAVREMFESGNFIDIYYNYEPRFNKPPLTYYLSALSCFIFGISEFAIRLPIVLMALGSVFLTFLIGRRLYGFKVGIISAFIMSVSLQFIGNSRYVSPEVPLTFFFLLTLYLFLIGYKEKNFKYILLSYISLGLVVLTKGFPYIFVIGAIVIFYLLIENNFNLKNFWKDFLFLKIWIGLPITIAIGFWWYIYEYLKFGDSFWNVYYKETFGRALNKPTPFFSIKNLTYYWIVILWAFLPFSLAFYFALIKYFKQLKTFSFIFAWFWIMIIIFTIAKGKLPTYIIQAFPAMSILTAYFIVNYKPENLKKYLYYLSFLIPTFLFMAAIGYLVYVLHLDYFYYIFVVFPLLYIVRYKDIALAPFLASILLFLMFSISVLPKIEKYRPYDKIGKAIEDNLIHPSIPLIIENKFFHNLPFYAKRKVLRDYPLNKILKAKKPILALVLEKDYKYFKNTDVLWEGYLYNKGSESQFMKFLKAVIKAEKGDYSDFRKWKLIYMR
ncbi:ArnT family glycosyltransferase [Hydrogenothermus marinus]|uniref:Dolichyl-phosphate-mannose-protein mannosyltransferase n=1 Tax=Hydrogenothermus marinus TaxID=133270 RepID=A0A3M0BSW9_9AQUI|nr:glycosyltransferase family 39 protein [Hydrogenothermus marinus]RMA97605.1 dolichyl-phosphate-mannose-protein mannosyltransferase [Hydrogenothermus marinus]